MAAQTTFRPFVSAEESPKELSIRALLLGALFGVIFGAVTVYVGLKAGLTVAASIPISVLSISILRVFGRASILENNIVQTTGNAGQSIASGVIFTLPALIFLGFDLEASRIFALALFGGWLGVLFMIPLRRQLIVEEHGTLVYPEGTACADVLKAGEQGGSFASRVFLGLGMGGLYALFQNENLLALFPGTPNWSPNFDPNGQQILKGAAIRADVTPEYLGVGYIIGLRVAAIMLAGGVFSWLVLMPAIVFFGKHLHGAAVSGDGADQHDGPEFAVEDVCAADGRGRGRGERTDYAAAHGADDCERADRGLCEDGREEGRGQREASAYRRRSVDGGGGRWQPDSGHADGAVPAVQAGSGSAGGLAGEHRGGAAGGGVRVSVCDGERADCGHRGIELRAR